MRSKKHSKKAPIASFQVKTSPKSRLYFDVHVWTTGREMQKHLHWFKLGRKCRGSCSSYTVYQVSKNGTQKLMPKLGEINFQKQWLTTEILSHEVTHAAFGYGRRAKLDLQKQDAGSSASGDEEKVCYAQGFMLKQIVNKLWALGLINK